MHIGPLPAVLRDIRDDGRTVEDIIAALESKNVAVFAKQIFKENIEPIPAKGTRYNFLATVGRELPTEIKSDVETVFRAALEQHGNLRRPSLRSALLLMEKMTEKRLFADIFVMNLPVVDLDIGNYVFVGLGRQDEEGQSWIAVVGSDYSFDSSDHDQEVILFLGPDA